MSGYMKDKVAARKNVGKTTPAATTPIANAHANAVLVQRRVGQDSQAPKPDPTPNNGHTTFRFVSIGLSVEILRRKQVSSTNRDYPHQFAVWRAERAHSARPTANWITPRASLSSLNRTAFRFVLIGLSVEILRRKQVSSTNRDCPHQLAVWRAERADSARPTATWITPRASLSSLDRTAFCFVSI
ncbi:hypothetical protein F2Q69_00035828 [Brassica cretica]|uniref:Uncharacterized protein n=1 Tax=Brassica cretica TaxID=69181 RepID=A0A8S9SRG5_BRACR|nr:hypothetical protein F2Q69_00035828 [Brassica cretica]